MKSLTWAYQLHYYLCFRTHRRSRSLPSIESLLKTLIYDICERHDYRLLAFFNSGVGRALTDYWLRVAAKRRFAIDQVSTIPDHIHLIVRVVPSMSIEECALLLMNNGQYFMAKNFPQLLIQARIDQLWQSSAYAGTCGRYTTGLMQRWLRSE